MRTLHAITPIALLLALTLLLSACAGSPAPSAAPTAGAATAAPADAGQAATDEPAAPKGWSGKISYAPYMLGPVSNDVITPLLEEKLKEYGYDVELENVYIENAQYIELLSLMLTSDEAPDIFEPRSITLLNQFHDQGVIASWDRAFFEANAPVSVAFVNNGGPDGIYGEYTDLWWQLSHIGEEMVCVPSIQVNGAFSPLQPMYHEQWLANLGVSEVPTELDAFVELLYRFAKEDPDGNGKDDTYGLSTTALNVIFGAFGSFPGFLNMDYGQWYPVEGQLVHADMMPGNKDALALIKQLYDDKVLDPEFVTGENTSGGYWAISNSFINGRIGFTYSANVGHYQPEEITGTVGAVLKEYKLIRGEDAMVTFGAYPKGPDGHSGGMKRSPVTVEQALSYNVDMDEEKLAACMQIMDIFSSDAALATLGRAGIEGVNYELVEGDSIPWQRSIDELDGAGKTAQGIMAARLLYGPETPLNEYLYRQALASPGNAYNKGIKTASAQMDTGYMNHLFTSLPSGAQYSTELQTYRDETWLKIIQGTLPLEAYDDYVEQWMSRGGAQLTQEANEWYNTVK